MLLIVLQTQSLDVVLGLFKRIANSKYGRATGRALKPLAIGGSTILKYAQPVMGKIRFSNQQVV